jgi:hypothetical protein
MNLYWVAVIGFSVNAYLLFEAARTLHHLYNAQVLLIKGVDVIVDKLGEKGPLCTEVRDARAELVSTVRLEGELNRSVS